MYTNISEISYERMNENAEKTYFNLLMYWILIEKNVVLGLK